MSSQNFYFPEPIGNNLPKEYTLILKEESLIESASELQSALAAINVLLSFNDCYQIYMKAQHIPVSENISNYLPIAIRPLRMLDRVNTVLLHEFTSQPVVIEALYDYDKPEELTTINIISSRRVKLSDALIARSSTGTSQDHESASLALDFVPRNTVAINEALSVVDHKLREKYLSEFQTGAFRKRETYFDVCERADGDPTALLFIEDYLQKTTEQLAKR
ncbi:hypothetical protein BM525_19925 (plasmid) [Alteromonas mediterranea]|uniref:Uncharacterized protein n=1 Tax=Alteromonas mediterranea TaxID=314275 RepID=A0AAC9JEC2_9ALTE|nr:hypothetical protein [Alteromonas mediterranea]APD92153.1 hypothetical protein BM524_19730 [Alteromonas mediterranea]APE00008.1 hypothetical protein BM525_19925 [Alteromonas mediterranea]